MNPGSDRESFKERLQECITATGSIAALAKKSGMVPNTIRRYLNESEPTRPMLAAIANAADVSPEWLAFGRSQKQSSDTLAGPDAELPFYPRFRSLVARHGGSEAFSQEFLLDATAVNKLLAGGSIDFGSLAKLASDWRIPIRWLVSDQPTHHSNVAFDNMALVNGFINHLDEIDERRLFDGAFDQNKDLDFPPFWREPILQLLERIYARVPPGSFEFHELKEAMGLYAAVGDLVVIDVYSKAPETGFFLFHDRDSPPDHVFMLRVTRVGGILRDVSFSGTRSSAAIKENDFTCLGRVILLVRKFAG